MIQEGLDPSVLDNPDSPSPNAGVVGGTTSPPPPPTTAPADVPLITAAGENIVAVKDDPMYSKYFKMAGLGIPKPQVAQKMMMEGLDPSIIEMDPTAPSPNASSIVVFGGFISYLFHIIAHTLYVFLSSVTFSKLIVLFCASLC